MWENFLLIHFKYYTTFPARKACIREKKFFFITRLKQYVVLCGVVTCAIHLEMICIL
jgi:hypothetical protein